MSRRKLPKEKKKETRLCYRAKQAQAVRKVNDAIHRIIHYPLDSDLSGGEGYPACEQLGQGGFAEHNAKRDK